MNCSERSHLPRPGRNFRQAIPRRERVLCDPCAEKLNNLGMDWRLVDVPFVAPWRARIQAKELTHA